MLFNSLAFVGFFVALYASYLLLRNHHKLQNRLLLVASYVFYGFWDWRFTSLLAFSTIVDFTIGRLLHSATDQKQRKRLLAASVVSNLTVLGFFKYFNFLIFGPGLKKQLWRYPEMNIIVERPS